MSPGTRARRLVMLAGAGIAVSLAGGGAVAAVSTLGGPGAAPEASPRTHVVATLRRLRPAGRLVRVGNFPGGAALTPDGRLLFTVSSGYGENGVQVVSVRAARVVSRVKLPGTSGGVALDAPRHLAYVSGEPDTDIAEVRAPAGTPGRGGDVIHVLRYDPRTGATAPASTIDVPPPAGAPALDQFPPIVPPAHRSWPERIAVSPDGRTLLVALGLADAAAVIDTATRSVRYVETGSHPFGAAILPDGRTGLVSNRGPGTVSVIDLASAKKTQDIQVGEHLSHPETIELDPAGTRAYVPLANADGVAVIDLRAMRLERTLSTALTAGPGSAPVSASVTPDGRELLVADSATDDIAVFALPVPASARRLPRRLAVAPLGGGPAFGLLGRIPTADYPIDVRAAMAAAGARCLAAPAGGRPVRSGRRVAVAERREACPKLIWTSAKGFGLGPNPGGPQAEPGDVPALRTTKGLVTGYTGIDDFPSARRRGRLSSLAAAQIVPVTHTAAPAETPLRPRGPIKHVFYIVKENRTYDQVLGDDPRGDGAAGYAIFGQKVTPNTHALARRFPLLDHVYANSEASIDGHYLTAAGDLSDYVHRTWRQNYAGRGYPGDAWFYQIAFPQTGFIFDRASEQGVSWVNLGEGVPHLVPLTDRDRTSAEQTGVLNRYRGADLGPAQTPGGCYDPYIGTDDLAGAAGVPLRVYDSSLPAAAPKPATSRFDCFRAKFNAWESLGRLPSLVYMTVPNDHTSGSSPGHHTPRAMLADNDLAVGQIVDLVSHSRDWADSAIFVVEDDSQDGVDHQDAHRIPALVISPYAKSGAVIHTPYDFLSVLRSVELILGLRPMNLFDSLATPMYDAFCSTPCNAPPYDALAPTHPLLEENPAQTGSSAQRAAARMDTSRPDRLPQRLLDRVLWKSVYGPQVEPPPPGPGAVPGA